MFELNSKHGPIVIYAETIENEAISQIMKMGNSILGKDAHIRIMPDAHAGAGCTIGTTMKIIDKVCPNFVGLDIGCGVTYALTDIDFRGKLEKLDKIIRENIPYGLTVRGDHKLAFEKLRELRCWNKLSAQAQNRALLSTGTLGGGKMIATCYRNVV